MKFIYALLIAGTITTCSIECARDGINNMTDYGQAHIQELNNI